MRKLITALALSVIATTSMAGSTYDCPGNVYDGDFAVPIGYADTIPDGHWYDESGNLKWVVIGYDLLNGLMSIGGISI